MAPKAKPAPLATGPVIEGFPSGQDDTSSNSLFSLTTQAVSALSIKPRLVAYVVEARYGEAAP